jgi:hypothetical protein
MAGTYVRPRVESYRDRGRGERRICERNLSILYLLWRAVAALGSDLFLFLRREAEFEVSGFEGGGRV